VLILLDDATVAGGIVKDRRLELVCSKSVMVVAKECSLKISD
jgi:hypothetical protein